jgi:hypothetical protein
MRRLLTMVVASVMGLALAAYPTTAAAWPPYEQPLVVVNSTTLLDIGFTDMAQSTSTGQLFLAGGAGSTVVNVADRNGQIIGSVPGQAGATGLSVSRDGSTVYAALNDAGSISAIDVATRTEKARYAIGDNTCPYDVALAGGKLWFSYGCYGISPAQIGSVDLADPATPVKLAQVSAYSLSYRPRLESGSINDNLLFAMVEHTYPNRLISYDVSSGTPVRRTSLERLQSVSEFAVSQDGASIVVATPGEYQGTTKLARYSTADLTEQGRYVVYDKVVGIAFGTDGRMATYSDSGSLAMFAKGEWEPRWAVYANYSQGHDPAHRGLGLSPEGRLFLATRHDVSDSIMSLTAVDASPVATSFTIDTPMPASPTVREPVTIRGALATADGSNTGVQTLHVTRNDRRGTVALDDVKTASDGSFTFTDTPLTTGDTSWVFSFDGTERLLSSTHTVTVPVTR